MSVSLPELERLLDDAEMAAEVGEPWQVSAAEKALNEAARDALPALIAAVKALVDLRYAPPSQETDASRSAAIALAAFSFEAEA